MKKTLLCFSIGMLWVSLAAAQESTMSQSANPSSDNTAASSVQGCLSGTDGNYMLTQDGTGTMYKLMGSEDQLKKHMNHEVAVTGMMSGAGSAASGSDQNQAASASPGGSSIQVSDVKMISKECSSGTSSMQSH